jgi:hypothetical protein
MPEQIITDKAIRDFATWLIRDSAKQIDYLDLAEHMHDQDSIGGVLIADLDGPDIDDIQRRILDAVHAWGNEEPEPTRAHTEDVDAVRQTEEATLEAAAAARLRAWFEDTSGPLVMDEADFDDVETVLADYERAMAERKQLRDEYGIRVTYTSTRSAEGAVADTLAGALAALDRLDAENRSDVISRELIQRPVGDWRKVTADAQ